MFKLNVSSSNFRKKIVSRTGFESKNFILDTNFTHKNEYNSLELTNFLQNVQVTNLIS
jgi:hypothetical protein